MKFRVYLLIIVIVKICANNLSKTPPKDKEIIKDINNIDSEDIRQIEQIEHSGNKITDVEVIIDDYQRSNMTIRLNNTDDFVEENINASIASNVTLKKKCDFKKLKAKIKVSKRLMDNLSMSLHNSTIRPNHTMPVDKSNSTLIMNKRNNTMPINNHSKNTTSNKNQTDANSTNSITSDDLLSIIADQTENIKNEICSSCLEINSSLNVLVGEIKKIKKTLNKYNNVTLPLTPTPASQKEILKKLSNCINNLNLIKADLFKLNEILDTIQKANCNNFTGNSKKYTLVLNSTNKLSEVIQNVLRKLNFNINLFVLN